eukprot:scaffold123257_cov16-Prasinocladus_malaysianus.AAC.1
MPDSPMDRVRRSFLYALAGMIALTAICKRSQEELYTKRHRIYKTATYTAICFSHQNPQNLHQIIVFVPWILTITAGSIL